jgi:hypothetical protein
MIYYKKHVLTGLFARPQGQANNRLRHWFVCLMTLISELNGRDVCLDVCVVSPQQVALVQQA